MPFLILEIGIMYANDLFPHLPPPGATAAQIRTMQIEQALSEAVAISRMQYYWYITYPIFGLVMALLYGILAGAQSFAYRALTETPDSTPNPL
jgi:ABC-type nitrate/sulfonate/bicarbonate transport system permease component